MSNDLEKLVAAEVQRQLAAIAADQTTKKVLEFLKNRNSADAYVVETGGDSTSWYRVWSDGFIEQGGALAMKSSSSQSDTGNNKAAVSLHKPFSNTDYVFLCLPCISKIGSAVDVTPTVWDYNSSSTRICLFDTNSDSMTVKWYACGY